MSAPDSSESGAQSLGEQPQSIRDATHGRVPDFFIVGHAKSGTTALYSMLRRHPQIFMPDAKEPWFFAEELHERTPPRPEGTPKTLEQYVAWFAGAGAEQQVGEASPLYLWSHTAAERIAQVRPDARIVAILREPASFLRSLHMQFVQSYVEVENDFAKALALEDARRAGHEIPRYTYWPQALLYSEHVRYVEQLRRYLAVFPREQLLVLTYDDFRADNEATVRQVLRFLGLDDGVPVQSLEVNPTVRARSQRMHELLHAVSVGRGPFSTAVKSAVKTVVPQRVRRGAVGTIRGRLLYAEPPPPDEATMLQLRRRFKPEVVALGEFLDRDVVRLWGYDSIA
ncbi:MAG: sulfotransferase family protein [Solirubrobacterales bacterium]